MHEATPTTGNRRLWITLLFCVAPLAILAAVFVFGIPVSRVILWALILLCPLSHLLHGHGGHNHGQTLQSRGNSSVPGAKTQTSGRGGSCH
jgi:hypothetical protein